MLIIVAVAAISFISYVSIEFGTKHAVKENTVYITKPNKTGVNQTFGMPVIKLNGTNSTKFTPFDFGGTLFGTKIPKDEQISIVQNVMKNINLKCYAVGFYTGLSNATFYDDRSMMEQIRSYIGTASPYDFVRNNYVRDYLEHFCLHLDSARQLPTNFTSNVGITMEEQMTKWHVNETTQNLGIHWYHNNVTKSYPQIIAGKSA